MFIPLVFIPLDAVQGVLCCDFDILVGKNKTVKLGAPYC